MEHPANRWNILNIECLIGEIDEAFQIRFTGRWVVDMDLEKFFDRVNHDVLMACVVRKVKDKRVLGFNSPIPASLPVSLGLAR